MSARLAEAGFEIVRLPELADDPDAVFVEDTALLLGEHAVITRPGAASRIGRDRIQRRTGFAAISSCTASKTGHVDGGDVLRHRPNPLRRPVRPGPTLKACVRSPTSSAPLGYEVVEAELRDCLHLKTGATFAGDDTLSLQPRPSTRRSSSAVEPLAVHETGCRQRRSRRRSADPARRQPAHRVTAPRPRIPGAEVDVSELQKAEAGVTCMSLIDERP